jgi:hypothetical protein
MNKFVIILCLFFVLVGYVVFLYIIQKNEPPLLDTSGSHGSSPSTFHASGEFTRPSVITAPAIKLPIEKQDSTKEHPSVPISIPDYIDLNAPLGDPIVEYQVYLKMAENGGVSHQQLARWDRYDPQVLADFILKEEKINPTALLTDIMLSIPHGMEPTPSNSKGLEIMDYLARKTTSLDVFSTAVVAIQGGDYPRRFRKLMLLELAHEDVNNLGNKAGEGAGVLAISISAMLREDDNQWLEEFESTHSLSKLQSYILSEYKSRLKTGF